MRNIFVSMVVIGLALAGCGGDGEDAFRPPAEGPPGGAVATQLTVSASAPSMPSDGTAP